MMKVVPATRTVLVELPVKFVLYTTACVQYQCRCTHRVPSVRPVASVNVQTCRVFVSKFPVHKIRIVPKVRLQLPQVNLTLGWEGRVVCSIPSVCTCILLIIFYVLLSYLVITSKPDECYFIKKDE